MKPNRCFLKEANIETRIPRRPKGIREVQQGNDQTLSGIEGYREREAKTESQTKESQQGLAFALASSLPFISVT